MSTASGIVSWPFCSQYQHRSGTSYSATTELPTSMPPNRPSVATTRDMKW